MEHSPISNPPKSVTIILIVLGLYSFANFAIGSLPGVLSGQIVTDFPNYYFAGQRILEGRPLYQDFAAEVRSTIGMDYHVYPADPPFTLVLLAPLALFSYPTAGAILIITSALIIGSITYATANASGWSQLSKFMFFALALGCTPTIFLLFRNHMEALVMAPLYVGWAALRSRKQILGGICWGLAAAMKLFPLMLIAALLRRELRTALCAAVGAFIATSLMGCLSIGIADAKLFIFDVLLRSERWLGAVGNYSVLSLFSALGIPELGIPLVALIYFATLYIYFKQNVDIDGAFGIGLCSALLISPLSWLNYLILILPLLTILPTRFRMNSRWRLIGYAILGLILGFTPGYIPLGSGALNILINHLPTLALAVCGIWWIAERGLARQPGPAKPFHQ